MIEPSTETDNQRRFDQHLLGAIVICIPLILATPIIISTDTIFPFVVGRAIFARSIIEIIFTLWLILIICYPQHRPPKSWVMISLFIGLSVSIITSFTGVNFTRSLWSTFERMNGIIDQAHWLAFILVTSSIYRSFSSWRILFTLNLGMAGFISLIGIIQYYDPTDSFLFEYITFSDSTNYMESTWRNASFMAAYAMINSVLGLGLILQSIHNRQIKSALPKYINLGALDQPRFKLKGLHFLQIFWLLNTSLCFWALWLTASRGAIFGFMLGALILSGIYIYWKTGRIKTSITYVAVFLSLVVITLPIVVRVVDDLENSIPILWRILEPEGDSSYSRHMTALKASIDAYTEKPLFGWGPENYLIPWGKYSDMVPSGKVKPFDDGHNALTEKLVSQGTLGLLSSILICSTIIIALVRSMRRQSAHHRPFIIVVTAALIASFIQKLFTVDTVAVTLQLSLLIAFVVSEEGQLRIAAESDAQDDSHKLHYVKKIWLIVPIVALSIWSLYNYNYKPYQAARASREFLSASLLTDISANFNRSVDEFPALANIPRRLIIEHVGCGLATTLADADYIEAVDFVTQEGQEALQIEPQNWRVHAALAHTYQLASLRNLDHLEENFDYLKLAKAHVQEALRLAPNTSQTNRVKVQQERLEEQAESLSIDLKLQIIESCTSDRLTS